MTQGADTGIVRKKDKGILCRGYNVDMEEHGRIWHDQRTVRRVCLRHRISVEESGRADLSEDLG